MKRLKLMISVMSALYAVVSCTMDIDLDLDYPMTKEIVVNCLLKNDTIQTLDLTYSSPNIGERLFDEVTAADAKLYCEGEYVGTFIKKKGLGYSLHYTPEVNKSYQLVIDVDGYPQIKASTTFPHNFQFSPRHNNDSNICKSVLYFSVGGNTAPFWIYYTYRGDVYDSKKDVYPIALTGADMFMTQIATDHPRVDNFNAFDRFLFNTRLREHYGYLRIAPSGLERERTDFHLFGYLQWGLVFGMTVSDEYDQYLKSGLEKMMLYYSLNDPRSWFDETVVYSNIENGLGIFGAYNERFYQNHFYDSYTYGSVQN